MPLYVTLAALLGGVATEVTGLGRSWTLSYIDGVAVGVGAWGAVVAWRRRYVRLDLALLGYLALLVVLGVQTLVREDPAAIVGGSSRFVVASLLLFGLSQLVTERREPERVLWRWPTALAVFGCVLAAWTVASLVASLLDPALAGFYDVKRSVATPLGSSNYLAAFLLVALLIVFVHAVEEDRRWLWPSSAILIGLLATMSRGAIAAGVVVLIGLAVVWRDRHRFARAVGVVGVAGLAFGLIVSVVVTIAGPDDDVALASSEHTTVAEPASSGLAALDGIVSDIALGGRQQLYRDSWEAFTDHPVLGVGLNRLDTYTGRGGHPPHVNAHNLVLHALATTGLLGTLAYLVVWGVLLWRLWTAPASTARTALLAGIVALLLHAQVEALSHTRAVEALLVVVLVIAGSSAGTAGVLDLGRGRMTAQG